LIFEDEPFADLSKRMGRWYDVEFEFRNKNIEEEIINVAFDGETLVQALDYLKLIVKFNYRIEDKKVVIF
jgi:hypothetical protein